jgi:prepilin-type N-terminal cleavage/methylation domain-containing protein
MIPMRYRNTSTTGGFTLIELLVVISIVALLSGVVLSSLNTARAKSRDAKRLSEVRQLATALFLVADKNGGTYPSSGTAAKCLGTTGTCWGGTFSGDVAINASIAEFMSAIPSDPLASARTSKGDRYLYSDGASTIAQYCNGGLPYPTGPFIYWLPDATTQPTTAAACNNIGFPGCCGNQYTCAAGNACMYSLSK